MLKKSIPYLIVGLLAVCMFVYANRKIASIEFDYAKQAKEIARLHEEEINKINAAKEIEKAQLEANIAKLQQDLAANQKDYEKKLADLATKKEQEAKKLAAKAPADLADEVSKATGFKVYK